MRVQRLGVGSGTPHCGVAPSATGGHICQDLRVGVQGSGFRVWGSGFRVWGPGFGVQGLGFGVWSLGFMV